MVPIIAAGLIKAGGDLLSGIGKSKDDAATRAQNQANIDRQRQDDLTQRNRTWTQEDQTAGYNRAQQAAMNPARAQMMSAMMSRLGLQPNNMLQHPQQYTHTPGPVQTPQSANIYGNAYGDPATDRRMNDPAYIKMQGDLDHFRQLATNGGAPGKMFSKMVPKMQDAMNAKFGGYR